jgi:hypothetical protein
LRSSEAVRYTLYFALALAAVTGGAFLGTHAYVTRYHLLPPHPDWPDASDWGPLEPGLPRVAKRAVRAAWMALNWGGPQTEQMGGRAGVAVPDQGLEAAETYLESALAAAQRVEGEEGKRARRQVEILLADVRERLGGPRGLTEARRGWERVWDSLGEGDARWSRARTARKVGEVSMRLAHEVYGDQDRQDRDKAAQDAEQWLLRAAWEALGSSPPINDIKGEHSTESSATAARPATRSSSWRFWQSSSSAPTSITPSARPELAFLLRRLHSAAEAKEQPDDQPSTRSLVTTLLTLSSLLAKQGDLASSLTVAQTASTLVNAVRTEDAPDPTSTAAIASGRHSPALHADWLSVREAFLSVYTAELLRALSRPEPDSLALLSQAIATANTVLSDLSASSPYATPLTRPGTDIARDARRAGLMAANLSGLVHELGCGGKKSSQLGSRGKEWCGGDAAARDFYVTALRFASGLKPVRMNPVRPSTATASASAMAEGASLPKSLEERPKGDEVDEAGWMQSWSHYQRVRDRLEPLSSP